MFEEIMRAWVRFLFGNPLRTLTIAAIAYIAYRPDFVREMWRTAIVSAEQTIVALIPLGVVIAILYWLLRQIVRK